MALFQRKMKKEHKENLNGAHNTSEKEASEELINDAQDEISSHDAAAGESKKDRWMDDDATADSDKNADMQSALSELKDKQLRLLAEFDNYKKRTMRERIELFGTASKDVMVALLPVLDDFDRAKKSADNPNNEEIFSEGVTMVYNRLYNILQGLGLKAMVSTGEPFDAEYHEAITEIPVPDASMKGKVVDTIEKGYLLNDKIIRHAKVVVGN